MVIRLVEPSDTVEWLRLRSALWPDSDSGKLGEEITHSNPPLLPTLHATFVCSRPDGVLCGLVEVFVHSAAPGCKIDRIGYLEAWYVDEGWRGRGVGRAFVEMAKAWAKRKAAMKWHLKITH